MRVAVLWLGRVSQDTAGRTYLGEILGPLGDQPGLEVDVHVGDPDFEVPKSCRRVLHRVPSGLGFAGRVLTEPFVALRLSRQRYDVLLAPFNNVPPTWNGPSVVVQHNVLAFGDQLRHDVTGLRLRSLYWPLALRLSLRRARLVLTVSAYLAKLLTDRFGLDPARVRVVPYGVSRQLERGEPKYRGAGPTILVVSALRPYKRVDEAVVAFAEATRGDEGTLLIAGPATAEERAPLEALATTLGVGARLRFLGNVPHERLGDVYASADVLLYLSEIESFGLPVIEAMRAGVPVIARRIPGILEVAGDAPLWIHEHEGGAEAAVHLRRLLSDDALRAERVSAGRAQAAKYTWERAAELTADALRAASSPTAPVVQEPKMRSEFGR